LSGPFLSVVAPVYGNATTLPELAGRVEDALRAVCPFELILVDDACPSGSGEAIDLLAAVAPWVVPVRLARNGGQHRAVLEGLRRARGTWHAVLDADLQDPPEALPRLLERIRQGDAEVVFAGRRGRYESSRAIKTIMAILLDLPRDAGLYVLLSEDVRRRLLALEGPEPSVVAMIGCTGARCVSLPVARAARSDGASAYTGGMRLRSGLLSLRWGVRHRIDKSTPAATRGRPR
jgi:polyisoprenyl-phosphate glycosyltransferase